MHKVSVRKPEGKRLLEDLDVDGRIILKWILKVRDRRVWTEFTGLGP
jgi:hypothetical protein